VAVSLESTWLRRESLTLFPFLAAALLIALVHGPVRAFQVDGLAAWLSEGSCATLGDVAFELAPVGAPETIEGTEVAQSDPVGSGTAILVLFSESTIEASLTDIVEADHAVVVAAGERAADAVACGDVGGRMTLQMEGMVMPGDELIVGLREQGGSGYSGIAILVAEGLTTTVRVYLAEGLSGDSTRGSRAEATPSAAAIEASVWR
jgi:hypothetical protein